MSLGALQPLAWGQAVVASKSAPSGQRPIVDAAQNGVPIVHIAPPSAAGVSRNAYQQFNVNGNGLILNNSAAPVQTQLGGYISGNPQLGTLPARIIVNEVFGPDASVLKGTIEVAGRKADVIIANPNGLLCDACGFLNTGRATLTTGTPQYGGSGSLAGFSTARGTLTIGAGGLNATNLEQLDLIARGLVFEGEVWAKNLNVIAGANQVLYASIGVAPSSTPQEGGGSAPRFAVDIKDLGGMYANQVFLIATERGLGVNSSGRIAALQGNLQLASNGDLTLKDSYASRNISLTSAGNATLTGQTQTFQNPALAPTDGSAGGDIGVTATGLLTQQGALDAAGHVALTAAALDHRGSTVQRGTGTALTVQIAGAAQTGGTLYSAADLELTGKSVADQNGTLQAAGALRVSAQTLSFSGSRLTSGGPLALEATAGELTASAARIDTNNSASLRASGHLAQADSLLRAQQDIDLQAGSGITNRDSTVLARGSLRVGTAGALDNTGGQLTGSAAVVVAAGTLVNDASSNHQAVIASDFATTITAQGIGNRGGVVSAKTSLSVQTQGAAFDNTGGVVVSNGALDLHAGALDSSAGQIVSRGENGGALTIDAASLTNRGGVVDAAGAMTLAVRGALGNTAGGAIQAGTKAPANLVLAAGSLVNDGGTLSSGGMAQIATSGALSNDAGTVSSAAGTTVSAAQASNRGGRITSGGGTVWVSQALDNTGGAIVTVAALSLDTQGQALNNTQGVIGATGTIELASAALTNAQGNIVADGSMSLRTAGLVNTAGHIVSNAGSVRVSAAQLDNDRGVISGATTAGVSSTQAMTNRAGQVLAGDSVAIDASSLDNRDGRIEARNATLALGTGALDNTRGQLAAAAQLSLTSGAITNAQGRIASGNALVLDTQGGALDNTAGTIASQTSLDIRSAALANAGGELSARRVAGQSNSTGRVGIDTTGHALDTSGGRIVAEGDLQLNAGAVTGNATAGLIAANGNAVINVDSLAHAGTLQTGRQLVLNANGAITNSGSIAASQDATLSAATLTSTGGSSSIRAGRDLAVSATALTNHQATLQSGRDLALSTDQLGNLAGGQLLAGADLRIGGHAGSGAAIDNSAGLVSAQGSATLTAAALTNDAGRIEAGGAARLTAGAVSNRGGAIVSAHGGIDVVAAGLDNTGGQLIANLGSVTASAGQVDNTRGLVSASLAVNLTAGASALNNSAGKILSDGSVLLNAAGLTNTAGAVSAQHTDIALGSHVLDNTRGLIVGSSTLALAQSGLINAQGRIATDGSLTLDTHGQALDNNSGQIAAGGSLGVTSGVLVNRSGTLHGSGALTVDSGAFDNAQGQLSAATVAIDTHGQQLGNAAGRIVGDNGVQVNAGALVNTGGTLAATLAGAQATLAVGGLDNTDGLLSAAGNLQLTTSGALVNAGGTVHAAQDAVLQLQSLANTASPSGSRAAGQVIAGRDLSLTTQAALDNHTALIQSGRNASVQSGSLGNDGGVIDSHGTLDVLVSGAASNRGGVIRTANAAGTTGAGAITLSAASLDNTAGTLNATTTLSLRTAGALPNAAGGLVQASGGLLKVDAGSTDNRKGAIASAADLRATTGALDNTGGRIEAAADLQLDTRGGALLNNADATQAARIQAGGSATFSAGEATNLSRGSNGATITAQRLTLTAISLANTGTLAASSAGGALAIATTGALTNTGSGVIAAFGGNADLRSGTLTNRSGGTVYAQGGLSLMTTGALDNTAGQLLTDGALNAASTAFDNRAGLVQASSIGVKTSGGMLNNGTGGRVASSGDTTLAIGALSNVGGSVVSGRTLAVTASGTVDNSAGLLAGAQGLNLDATSQRVANAGGTIKSAQGDVGVHADVLQTDNGSIAAAGTASLQATTGIGNHGGAITGHDLSIATGTLDNTAGRIASDRDTTISSASTDNTDGEISAKRDLLLSATTLVNTRGQIVADNALTINTASRSLAGNVAGNDVTLNVQGDYANNGTLNARHNLTVNAHDIDNSGVLNAGNLLSANAQGRLTNAASGEISGASVALTATGGLVNDGLINATGSPAVDTGRASIQSASAANTGRLYGESIDVAAAQIANTGTGVIAARSSLTLAGDDIRNTGPDALLLSLGDMRLVGSVTGTIGSVTNTAGRIEAGGDLTISAGTILNANGGVQTALALIGSSALTTYVVPNGSATQYPLSQCRGISERWDQAFCILHPEIYGQRSGLAAVWDSVPGGPSTGDGGTSFVTTPHYAWNDPVYRQLNVAGPNTPRPAEPGGAGACTPTDSGGEGGGSSIPGPQCDPWRAAAAAWDNDYQPIGNQLQAAIDTYNASVAADNATVNFEDYTVLEVTETTRQSQVTASAPGKILSGRLLLLNGTNITNTDSQMVAGGLLYVNGVSGAAGAGGVNNIATPGQQVITYSGTATFTHLDSSCNFFGSCNHVRNDDPAQSYNPTPSPTPFDLPTVVFRQNASLTQGGTAQAGASAVSGTTASGAGSVGVSAIGNVIRPGTAPDDAVNAHAATSALQAAGSVSADTVTGASAIGATRSGTTSQATLAALTGIDGSGATAIVAPARSATGVTTVQRRAVNASDQKARDVILTVVPRLTLPANQLFQIHPEPGAKYLVETDPAFTNRQTFLSSDYFQQQLQLDPERSLKRYGDGFEEQRLVDDQILALTGRRFLSGYASTQDEYQALMNAGVAFARAYQLSPGVALSAEQMALLTTDIVWLSTQRVTLADGSTTQVLVPQVYLRQPQSGDLAPSGALMAGSSIVVKTAGQLVNSASLQGDSIDASAADIGNSGLIAANRELVLHASNDLSNLGGSIVSAGGSISLTAGRDLLLQTRTIDTSLTTTTANGSSTSSRTNIDRIATVQAGGDLLLSAGRDLGVQGASLSAAGEL